MSNLDTPSADVGGNRFRSWGGEPLKLSHAPSDVCSRNALFFAEPDFAGHLRSTRHCLGGSSGAVDNSPCHNSCFSAPICGARSYTTTQNHDCCIDVYPPSPGKPQARGHEPPRAFVLLCPWLRGRFKFSPAPPQTDIPARAPSADVLAWWGPLRYTCAAER
jgi:hypothetical protein